MKRNLLTLGLLSLAFAACGGGENGQNGKNGKDGASCIIADNGDGSASITCPDGSSFIVQNGNKGPKGDAGSDGENGQNGSYCQLVENSDGSLAVVCPADGSSFIVRGNTNNYTNYCAHGFYGKNCENKCNCGEHGNCNDGVTGDGSCICEIDFYGKNCENECSCNEHQDCNDSVTGDGSCICKKGYYGNNCFDCTKGAAGSYFGKEECTYIDTRDSNSEIIYPVVKIGDQIWMAQNMAYAPADKELGKDYFYPDGNSDNFIIGDDLYGYLYTLDTAIDVCPSGWHLPTKTEFDDLQSYITDNLTADNIFLSLIKNSTGWKENNNKGFDEFGFSALPAGHHSASIGYRDFGLRCYFWLFPKYKDWGDWGYAFLINNSYIDTPYSIKTNSYSVRCLRD